MSKWINRFLAKEIVNRSDKNDRFKMESNMSPLSLRSPGDLDRNLENTPRYGGDKSDRFKIEPNMSPLSLYSPDAFDRNFSHYDQYDFEERLAIAEYDGKGSTLHAHRIAYLDAFITALITLAEDEPEYQDWMKQRIQIALAWLETQEFPTLNLKQ